MTEGPPAAGASRAANSARVPAKFLLRHNARWGRGGDARSTPAGALGPRTRGAAPAAAAQAAAAAGDSRRKLPAPLERVPPARSSAGRAEGPGGGAAVVYLRPRGRVTWARWNVRLVAAPHSTARARPAPPARAPPRSADVTGVARGAGGGRAGGTREGERCGAGGLRGQGVPGSCGRGGGSLPALAAPQPRVSVLRHCALLLRMVAGWALCGEATPL